jgi:DHA1 family tetracycline resistance protein-like MFS transporter
MMSSRVGPDEQGRLQGAQGSLMGVASMAAPILFTQAFSAAIGPYRSWNVPGVPFVIAALLLMGALFVALRAVAQPSRVSAM